MAADWVLGKYTLAVVVSTKLFLLFSTVLLWFSSSLLLLTGCSVGPGFGPRGREEVVLLLVLTVEEAGGVVVVVAEVGATPSPLSKMVAVLFITGFRVILSRLVRNRKPG